MRYPKNRKSAKEDLTGRRFGYLTVVEFDESVNGATKWWCMCDCGNKVSVYSGNMKRRQNPSCGCKRSEKISKAKSTQGGASKHPLWFCYKAMVSRCTNPKDSAYKNYGERGITVCQEWVESFWKFLEDMGERPSDKHSIERINNSLGYSLSNCKWEVKSKQQFNRRKDPNNTSGRTGVYWREDRGKWYSQIDVDCETIRLGTFLNFEDAVKAREEAELKYYGFIKE